MKNERSWFTCRVDDSDGVAEIHIYDEIGLWGISAMDFINEYKRVTAGAEPDHIVVRINSPGGEVFDGIAIYNYLRSRSASVTVWIDGLAASMASVIAMAGDAVLMPENAMLMIHDPSGIVVGTSKEMRELADALDKVKGSLVSAYASKSGMDRDEIHALMEAETWLTAAEAVELGFADSIEQPVAMAANFNLDKFRSVPEAFAARLSANRKGKSSMTDVANTPVEDAAPAPAEAAADVTPAPAADPAPAPVEAAADAAPAPAEDPAPAPAAEPDRVTEIMALCRLAGKTAEQTLDFIASGKSVAEVRAALLEAAANPGEIANQNVRQTDNQMRAVASAGGVRIDANAIYARLNAARSR